MGTINYGSSDYINMGRDLRNYPDLTGLDYEGITAAIEDMIYNNDLNFFTIDIKPGYYDGFYLNIEYTGPSVFYDYSDKREALKEVTRIKRLLYALSRMGVVQYSPGWCMGYYTASETRANINKAVKEMRQDIRETPTEYTYNAEGV